jgi:hypothetical protein
MLDEDDVEENIEEKDVLKGEDVTVGALEAMGIETESKLASNSRKRPQIRAAARSHKLAEMQPFPTSRVSSR